MKLGREINMAQDRDLDKSAIFAEEDFVVELQIFLHGLMEKKGFSRADLAREMGVSRARITQIFSDECTNFTVRLLARAVHALGETPVIECESDRRARACGRVWPESLLAPEDLQRVWQMQDDFTEIRQKVAANDHRPKRTVGYTFSPMEWEAA
jgi:transcriptional regulator with XRE-family HTH domain